MTTASSLLTVLTYIRPRLDPGQFGGNKGGSVKKYLVVFVNFILSNTDNSRKVPKAVMAAFVDMSKGFTRINHNRVFIRLSDWNVPGWLLRIVSSYLTNRTLVVKFKGVLSKEHPLPGGGPQDNPIGHLLFLVEASDSGMDLPPPLPPGSSIYDVPSVPAPPPPLETNNKLRQKYIDDQTQAEVVRLDSSLASYRDWMTFKHMPTNMR